MKSIISQIVSRFKLSNIGFSEKKVSHLLVFLSRSFWVILTLFLIISSFLLGRITKFMENKPSFTFESKEIEEKNYEKEKDNLFGKVPTGTIVASRGGKKYYFVWCKGSANIKESNKIYFNTEELAQKAGYTIAANCR